MYFQHAENDFSINIEAKGRGYVIEMALGGEKISADDIRFIADEEDFSNFTYADWKEYFQFMKEEWEIDG